MALEEINTTVMRPDSETIRKTRTEAATVIKGEQKKTFTLTQRVENDMSRDTTIKACSL